MDERMKKLAETLVGYSCNIQKGEKVLIALNGHDAVNIGRLLIKEVYKREAYPFVDLKDQRITRELMLLSNKEQVDILASFEAARMDKMDAYISVGAGANSAELSDVPSEKHRLYDLYYTTPVHYNIRIMKTKWVVLRYPTNSMAQLANMSLEKFEDYYYNVCTLDYEKMSKAMDNLTALLDKTDNVRIVGPGTDLTFSINGIPSVKCAGKMNIPDGEVYTAPVKHSVNGVVTYNTPSEYNGTTFENVSLEFKDGKIIRENGTYADKLKDIFDTDEGARYVGEFALGVNPYITFPMKNTLFDEKISGSFHFTPGQSYKDASNGNSSSIHWDLVSIQTKEYGGGEIYFDGKIVRKDGIFVHEDLLCLNPDELM